MSRRGIEDALGERSARRFMVATALADAMSAATLLVAKRHRMRPVEVMDALVTQVVSYVQAQVPVEEWGDVGVVLAEQLRRGLTVIGDTGADHWRRQV